VNVFSRIRRWWSKRGDESSWDGETPAWLASFMVHLAILSGMALVGTVVQHHAEITTLLAGPTASEDPMTTSEEFSYSPVQQEAIGSSSGNDAQSIVATAPALAMTASLPASPAELEAPSAPVGSEPIRIQDDIRVATAPRLAETFSIKGAVGVGTTGATGAIDRITQEILAKLEERPTLVVWLFDQSGSLRLQREEVNKKFDRIYEELGVIEASDNPAFKQHENKPLLTAVMAFGEKISLLTPKPTDDVQKIKSVVAAMETDPSGTERTFEAVIQAVERYRPLRAAGRTVMLVIFTDEVGDDEKELDQAVKLCLRNEIPVYCIGVPAPFGERDGLIKYVDPDKKYDQTPQDVPVRQGPESYQPELVHFSGKYDEPMDSGFGPYSLARLCYETGGIYFAVHPNRDERHPVRREQTAVLSPQLTYFFDPQIMLNYRPEYFSIKEYNKLLNENRARAALVKAAQMPAVTPMERPQLVFPKRSDADLANRLAQAQHGAALVEFKLDELYDTLRQGEKDRDRLTLPRWKAGYDLSMGRVLALKVRAATYNAMLAKVRGMRFQDPKDDTWRLAPSDEITVGSTLEKQAAQAKTYLERVMRDHKDTPWAMLAQKELKEPLGWTWKEMHTGVNEPPKAQPKANNPPRPPRDEKAKMLPQPVKRPVPKL
jgi:hypothetical protein